MRDPLTAKVRLFAVGADQNGAELPGAEDTIGFAVRAVPAPRAAGASPREVGMAGSSGFTLTGQDFGLRDMSLGVSIGETPAAGAVWVSDTLIYVMTPPSADARRPFAVALAPRAPLEPAPAGNVSVTYVQVCPNDCPPPPPSLPY